MYNTGTQLAPSKPPPKVAKPLIYASPPDIQARSPPAVKPKSKKHLHHVFSDLVLNHFIVMYLHMLFQFCTIFLTALVFIECLVVASELQTEVKPPPEPSKPTESPKAEHESPLLSPSKPEPSSSIRDIIRQYQNRPTPEPKAFEPVR